MIFFEQRWEVCILIIKKSCDAMFIYAKLSFLFLSIYFSEDDQYMGGMCGRHVYFVGFFLTLRVEVDP